MTADVIEQDWDYEQIPVVMRLTTNDEGVVVGSHPDPPFQPAFTHLQMLRHHAALVTSKTGIRVRVCESIYSINSELKEDYFDFMTPHATSGPHAYLHALGWLNAFEDGIREARWVDSQTNPKEISHG